MSDERNLFNVTPHAIEERHPAGTTGWGCISGAAPYYGECDPIYAERERMRFNHLSEHYAPLAQPPMTLARAWRERTGAPKRWKGWFTMVAVVGGLCLMFGGFTFLAKSDCNCHFWFYPPDGAHLAHFACATLLLLKVFFRCSNMSTYGEDGPF